LGDRVEWFKLSKQRPAVRPEVPAAVEQPSAEKLAAELAAMPRPAAWPSPKVVFDNPRETRPIIRPAPAPKTGFTVSASKDGESNEIQLTSPTLTVAKARMLFKSGWRVHVTNAAGRQFAPSEFDQILKFD
jgi:hypothetical protein